MDGRVPYDVVKTPSHACGQDGQEQWSSRIRGRRPIVLARGQAAAHQAQGHGQGTAQAHVMYVYPQLVDGLIAHTSPPLLNGR